MGVILPVFRVILMGAGTLFALHLTNPQLTEPLYELALAGAKELAIFGANALSSRIDIFAWLLGTGAAWNSIRLAEKAKHALGQLYEAGEHYALHPARVMETLEENAKWLGLLSVDLPNSPLHTAAYGKELMGVPEPFINIDVCIPGEVGWCDAGAAVAFKAAMGDVVDVSMVPDPPDQGVCIAGYNETAAAANSTMTTAAFFQPNAKTAAVVVPTSTAIVVEPAIAGGHVAQPINTFTAGFYAHVIGLPPHGHIPNSTSASAIAPLAVPEPATAVNVTKIHALVHWDHEAQPYDRAVLHARAAGQVHWYIIITGCLILVLSVSCRDRDLAIQQDESSDMDTVDTAACKTTTAVEDADTEEKSMATIVTTAADTVNKTDAPVVQDLSLEVEVKMGSNKHETTEAEDDTAAVGLLKSIWAPQAQNSQDTGDTPTVLELALEIGDTNTADKSAQKMIKPSVDDGVETETVLTGAGIGASMWATQVEVNTSTTSDNASTTLVELELKATDKREDYDEEAGTKASMWAPKNEIRTYHSPAVTPSVFCSEVDSKTQDKDVTVGTNASIWAPKDNAKTDNVPVTEAPTAYAATSAVEDSIPLARGVTESGAGALTGSGGDSDATTAVPHNSAIANLEQYKLDQSCLSDAAKNELAAMARSMRTWGGKKRLFNLLPAFKEAITEDAGASTSEVPPPAVTARTSPAPPTADPALAPAPALVPAPAPARVLNAQQRRARKRRAALEEERRVREEEQNATRAAQLAVLTGIKKDAPLDSVYGADWKERFPQMQERLLATRWLTVYPERGAATVAEGEEEENA